MHKQRKAVGHMMLGNFVNVAAILGGSLLGFIFKKKINKNTSASVFRVLGLCVLYIGIAGVLETENPLLLIVSMAIGTVIGETLDIEGFLERTSQKLETMLKADEGSGLKEGFLTATLLFCVGSMAIIGPIESALTGNHTTLFAKSVLDGISSIVFAGTIGAAGVALSSLPLFTYQGSIAIFAGILKPFMTPELITALASTGSLMILGLGLNMVLDAKLKISNMLPALLVPVVYFSALAWIG